MKKKDIVEGGHYTAKVNGKLTTVRVDKIRRQVQPGRYSNDCTVYDVTNLATDRQITFRSAQKFRCTAKPGPKAPTWNPNADSRMDLGASEPTHGKNQEKLADKLRQKKDTGVDTAPHLIIIARAGTGKTTTLVEGLKWLKGLKSSVVPSPQQQAVWTAICQSEGKAQTVCFVAFNKSIATELQQRVPEGCQAMTMHSMGYRAVRRAFPNLGNPNSYRVQDIIAELLETDIRDLRRTKPVFIQATEKLVNLCKINLRGGSGTDWEFVLQELAAHYDIDLNGQQAGVFALVPRVLERCKDVARDSCIDFADMVWLPIALDLPVYRYDLLLVDEAQDLNRCQQELAIKAGRRLILCGDPKQAIYGFAGADSESMIRMADILNRVSPDARADIVGKVDGRGCTTLPLTVTRRCGKAIVEEAKKIVPDFEAHESNSEGLVHTSSFKDKGTEKVAPLSESCYRGYVGNGDMILCRVNAPLVSECFKFLREGRKANIQGRDVGQGLISTIQKLMKNFKPWNPPTVDDSALTGVQEIPILMASLSDWLRQEQRKENAKRNPSEARSIALQDRYDCLVCFTEDIHTEVCCRLCLGERQYEDGDDCPDCNGRGVEYLPGTVRQVIQKIEDVFTDDKHGEGIKLSSIHKAKGLEAKRVFLLQPEGATIPHPMAKSAWQREQEMNLLYVAITRAKEELIYVS